LVLSEEGREEKGRKGREGAGREGEGGEVDSDNTATAAAARMTITTKRIIVSAVVHDVSSQLVRWVNKKLANALS